MKWTVFNVLGGLTWLAGLCLAKGTTLPGDNFLPLGDHRMLVGFTFGLAGLGLLLWTNLRNTA